MSSRIPLATYRLQFNSNFRFHDAISILDYLRDLGISHVYASPILSSRCGSGHGYDAIDPSAIDQDLGGPEDFALFEAALAERRLGLILDIVPNHMAASSENHWWMDVLEFGYESAFSSYFDIDWSSASRLLAGKLLLPFLGAPFGEVLNAGELRVALRDGRFFLHYFDHTFPFSPSSYAEILGQCQADAQVILDQDSPLALEWQGIVALAQSLLQSNGTASQAAERRVRFGGLRDRLKHLLASSPAVRACIDRGLERLNGAAGHPASFVKLEQILGAQHYRLAYWQSPSEAINYRRFFSITDLVGIRVEDSSVFDATHDLIVRTAQNPTCAGFRIDHIDGLRDPSAYLNRLRDRLARPGTSRASARQSEIVEPYVIVEKILAKDEQLPAEWPVNGTTGYDFMNACTRLFVDESRASQLEKIYADWTGLRTDFDDVVYEKKKLVMHTLFGIEMRTLGRELGELARDDRYARELHPAELAETLIEVTACLPVYRTYIQSLDIPENTRQLLASAINTARDRRSTLPARYFDFLADVLLLAAPAHVRADQRELRLAFVARWQQFTGSIMAKGVEDTALYVYFPLASLNEVGGDPRVGSDGPASFHQFVAARHTNWPNGLNSTTTHDTKRSEDTRARISVLSEVPEHWAQCLREWSHMNERHIAKVDGTTVPDRNEEYLFYQTLIGAWPLQENDWGALVPRLQDYFLKASREADIRTRWVAPNHLHEAALREFVARTLNRETNREFCASLQQFMDKIGPYGMLNGLSQTLLKCTCPGVPDTYQGSEMWDLRLVDPDNRGVIDFDLRAAMLSALNSPQGTRSSDDVEDLVATWRGGSVKMHVLSRSLKLRHQMPQLFCDGSYEVLRAAGEHAYRVVAFARENAEAWSVTIFPRCMASVQGPVVHSECRRKFWQKTDLLLPLGAPKCWVNIFSGRASAKVEVESNGRLSLSEVFEEFPVALLIPSSST